MKTATNADDILSGGIDERRQDLDRRNASRRKVLKGGRVLWPNGDSSECIVINISERGAHLRLHGPAPSFFDLVVEGDQWRRSCSVIWRKANRIGVKFQEQAHLVSSVKRIDEFRRHIDECRILATRAAAPSDRDLLLEMAEAWIAVIRRLRRLQGKNH